MVAINSDKPRMTAKGNTFAGIAGESIPGGAMVALNASGELVNAADTAGLIVVGCALHAAASGDVLSYSRDRHYYSSGVDAEELTGADVGKVCYALDNDTVGKVGGSNNIPAGIILAVDAANGILVDVSAAAVV